MRNESLALALALLTSSLKVLYVAPHGIPRPQFLIYEEPTALCSRLFLLYHGARATAEGSGAFVHPQLTGITTILIL